MQPIKDEIISRKRKYHSDILGETIFVTAKVGWSMIEGNVSPYITATGHARSTESTNVDNLGAICEIIAEAFPDFAPITKLTLSNAITGEPLYAKANGFYWLTSNHPSRRGSVPKDWITLTPAQRTASYLRCEPELFDNVSTREEFDAVIDSLKPRWQEEVRTALLDLNIPLPTVD